MDPNYHYIISSEGTLFINSTVRFKDIGLPERIDKYYTHIDDINVYEPIDSAFYTYRTPDTQWNDYDANTDKFIDYVLKIDAEKAKHISTLGGEFSIVRVPKELEEYTYLAERSYGCCGGDIETYVKIDRNKAIIDLTKKTLEDPTPEKLSHLKEKIAFFENVQIETVKTLFSKCADKCYNTYNHN